MSEVTQLLKAVKEGDAKATDALIPLVYDELRAMAYRKMSNEKPGQTLQATDLVHEAYLKLVGNVDEQWNSRGHFFSAASEAMRRILIDRARKKAAKKRNANIKPIDLDQIDIAVNTCDEHLLLVNDALNSFNEVDSDCAELVKLRFFAGLSSKEAAAALGISERSARRAWAYARSWLYNYLRKQT